MAEKTSETEPIKLEFLGSLDIIQTIKNSQSENGLKHEDYTRYRKYTAKKVKILRKQLSFKHQKPKKNVKFAFKDITQEHPNEQKMLLTLLYQSEYYWAYAMDLRQEQTQKPEDKGNRMTFHVVKKLNKAHQIATQLSKICQERTDKITAQESEAYKSFLGGFLYHEKQNWKEGLQQYVKSRQLFTELSKVSDTLKNTFYQEQIDQLDQSIRYVYQQTGGSILDTIEVILSKFKGDTIDLSEIQQIKDKNFIEIEFQRTKYPIKNPKVNDLYIKAQQSQLKLKDLQGFSQEVAEKRFNTYLQLFSLYDDILKYVTKDKDEAKSSEAEKQIHQGIIDFFQSQKFIYILQRNSIQINMAIKKFEKENGINNLQEIMTKKAFKLKLTRPAEIVKLCDNYIQVSKQLQDIERKDQRLETFKKSNSFEVLYRGIRCYYVSLIYFSNDKYIETISLLDQTNNYLDYANQKLNEIPTEDHLELYQQFQQNISTLKIRVQIKYLETKQKQQNQPQQSVKSNKQDQSHHKGTIMQIYEQSQNSQVQDLDVSKLSNNVITDIPPKPALSGCKPIFFDLAHHNLNYPDISGKFQEEKKEGFFSKWNFFKK